MKRNRPYKPKEVVLSFVESLELCKKKVKALPEIIVTRGERRKLELQINFLTKNLSEIKKRNDEWVKVHEEFHRHLLEELKKEKINVRPTQGDTLQTVVWSIGRKKKVTKPVSSLPTKGKKRKMSKKK